VDFEQAIEGGLSLRHPNLREFALTMIKFVTC
jgi:hypothetical protein